MTVANDIQTIRRRSAPVFRKYGVRKAAIFGSFARGEHRRKSDVDFLVDIPSNMDLFEFVGLKHGLESSLGRKVDLVTYKFIKPLLKNRILNEQIKIYEKRS